MASILLVCCQKPSGSSGGNAETPPIAGGASAQQAETEIPANTALWIRLGKALDSSKLKVGDRFKGEIAEDVVFGGKPIIPKGSSATGRVTNSQTAQGQGSAGYLTVVLDSVSVHGATYNVNTGPATLEAPALKQDLPSNVPENRDVKGAYAPKNGVLQFFTTSSIRVKS